MSTIIYNENGDIIGDILPSTTDKGYYYAGFFNANDKRIVDFFRGKKSAINFLKLKNIIQ